MKKVAPYSRLAELYDLDWSYWPKPYFSLCRELLLEKHVTSGEALDLGCGTGSLALALADEGWHVTAVDLSPEMIAMARTKTGGRIHVSFTTADMATYTSRGSYHLVLSSYGALNYLCDPRKLATVFQMVSSALAPGGLFIFDLDTEHMYLNRKDNILERRLGGENFLQKTRYCSADRLFTTVLEFSEGEQEVHHQRPYEFSEVEEYLCGANLVVREVYSGFNRSAFEESCDRAIYVAGLQCEK